ncbi:MAG: gamma-glutamyltransferase, partial [Candidatus Latescibacteria bacterium]|nr:gamma-glutamyltransferase [Candidatus Latescibacterota bacterium]
PGPGERWCNRDMAKTMRMLAKGGRESFYQGEIAEAIAFFAQNNGGFLSVEDMANHQTQLIEPIRTTYRGHEVLGQPPASQGLIMLEELNILEGFPISEWGHLSADSLHHSIEAKKLAFADRIAYIGDPNSTDNPLDALLSKDFANTRAKEIDPEKASSSAKAGELPNHDTTYFCVMDGEGNAVSFIQSIFAEFGAGCVVEGTGMLMNNRMNGFYLDPDSPNVLAPGKKPIHTLNAYMLIKDGKPSLVCGTPGGDVQVQTNLQIIEAVVDHGITLQEAIEAPRWNHGGDIVALEDRVPDDTVAELERRGHRAKSSGAWGGSGHVQGVMIHSDNGAMMIGSDPRCDGCGLGW